MAKGVGYRPLLEVPKARQLQRSYRPYMTCVVVSVCLALLICIVFGLTAYNIYDHRFGENTMKYHAGDQVSLWRAASDLTPVFCSSYSVRTKQVADFYFLQHKAEIDLGRRENFTWDISTALGGELYVISAHFLPEGSSVLLTSCRGSPSARPVQATQVPAEILVIKSDTYFRGWRKHFNHRYVHRRMTVPMNATCRDSSSQPHLSLTISDADNYYFILIIDDTPDLAKPISETVHLDGQVSKTVYNIQNATTVCYRNKSICNFPLEWGEKPDVVAQVTGSNSYEPQSFVTLCQVRVWFWVPVFAAVPLCLTMLSSLWCWWLLVKKKNIKHHYQHRRGENCLTSEVSRTVVTNAGYGATDSPGPPVPGPSPPPALDSDDEGPNRCASLQ